jgi:hypothetical protein
VLTSRLADGCFGAARFATHKDHDAMMVDHRDGSVRAAVCGMRTITDDTTMRVPVISRDANRRRAGRTTRQAPSRPPRIQENVMIQRIRSRFAVVLFVLLGAATASPFAHAQLFRAYLALGGNDANPCTIGSPCRLLPAALAAVRDGGEIWMLDSANFNTGPVTVTKGVKILAIPGEMGSVVGNGGDAIVINAPGKDVTLRNLFVLNLNAGINGVNIQDAGAVHIEKTSIHDFSDTTGACILLSAATTVRVYVDDSFLRHCRTGIHAVGTASIANPPSVIVDNTRFERSVNDTAPQTFGIWQQGCIDVVLRNSIISRQDVGIHVDSLPTPCAAHLQLSQVELTRNNTGIRVQNATTNGQLGVSIAGSRIQNNTDGILMSNSGDTTAIALDVADSDIGYCGNNCVTLNNDATDGVRGIQANLVRTQIHTATDALAVAVPNGSRVRVWARDSTLANATRLIRTSGAGTSTLTISLIRSNLNNSDYALDHGYGQVRLDGCHLTHLTNTFVNNGSGDVKSLGNNWVTNFANATGGFVYITPTIVTPM